MVTPPALVVAENKLVTEAPINTIVVKVPNGNGSYMSPITLQQYSDGFVEPNGEYYDSQPSIDKLNAYAKE